MPQKRLFAVAILHHRSSVLWYDIPCSTGICREFLERSPFARIRAGNPAADSKACAQIPVTQEQGISRAEQGILGAVAPFRKFRPARRKTGSIRAKPVTSNPAAIRATSRNRAKRFAARRPTNRRQVICCALTLRRRQSGDMLFVAR
jgi:hypothetical protein